MWGAVGRMDFWQVTKLFAMDKKNPRNEYGIFVIFHLPKRLIFFHRSSEMTCGSFISRLLSKTTSRHDWNS